MAMSAGPAEDGSPMSDINTTPLVDVMLVLLIIFLITVPVVIQTVPLKLPDIVFIPTTTKPENVLLSIKGGRSGPCQVFWGQTPIHSDELLNRAVTKLKAQVDAVGGPQNITADNMPEAHIRGDQDAAYKCIGGAIYNMQRAGFAKVGFISQPPPNTVAQ